MPRETLIQWNQSLDKASLANYSGSQLRAKDPKRYDSIVRSLQCGLTQAQVVEIFGISAPTAKAIQENEQVDELSDAALLKSLKHSVHIGAAQLRKELKDGKVKGDKLPVAIGILIDKIHQIEGKPTTIIRHERGNLDSDHLMKLVKTAKPDVIDAEVIETKVLDTNQPDTSHFQCDEKGGGGSPSQPVGG